MTLADLDFEKMGVAKLCLMDEVLGRPRLQGLKWVNIQLANLIRCVSKQSVHIPMANECYIPENDEAKPGDLVTIWKRAKDTWLITKSESMDVLQYRRLAGR